MARERIISACPRRALPLVLRFLQPKWRQDRLPLDVLSSIRSHGSHPFIVLRWATHDPPLIAACSTQNEADKFADQLSELADGGFVRGLRHALKGEAYEAASHLFDWIFDPADVINAYIFDCSDPPFPAYSSYPIFEIRVRGMTTPEDKIDLLVRIFDAYERARGNDRTRHVILEALGCVLSRSMGIRGEYSQAIEYAKRGSLNRNLVTVLRRATHDLPPLIAACPTQNEADKFADQLSELADSAFVRGLRHTLEGEAYEAASHLFDWTFDRADIVKAHIFGEEEGDACSTGST
jgi:hypothetical protein